MNGNLADLLGKDYYTYVAEEKSRYCIIMSKDDFLMRPVIDFAFKLLFGDPKRTERLKSLLAGILKISKEELDDISIINPELPKDFHDDKYGRLDIRAMLKDGRQIDIEMQVLNYSLMPERSLYYWSKMYSQQVVEGQEYDELKKCIAINILDYDFALVENVHSVYHITEDKTSKPLTEVLEIHFFDLEKLRKGKGIDGLEPSLLRWLRFLAAKSREELEMLARNDQEISEAYLRLKELSADDKKRMEYEARQAWLMDERSRIKQARKEGREEGREEGKEEGKLEVAKKALEVGMEISSIGKITGLPKSMIEKMAEGIRKP